MTDPLLIGQRHRLGHRPIVGLFFLTLITSTIVTSMWADPAALTAQEVSRADGASSGDQRAATQTQGNASARFPFVIPGLESSPSVTDRRPLVPAPAGKHGFLKVRDGKFYVGENRIKFWGMNVCFPANFPEHHVADRLAPHLAKLGVNAVRFHHMDNQDAPGGIWGGVDENGDRKFSEEMVDRLDYFLARLAENGIYADLNLHVSRTLTPEEGYPALSDVPWWADYNKWTMYYDRDVQAELKSYCRELLLHKNPYRNDLRRVDDPSIGLIEMLNENYFTKQGYGLYQRLPERYQDSLIAAWNRWLAERYDDTDAMRKSWADRQPELGAFAIEPTSFVDQLGSWQLSKGESEIKTQLGVDSPASSSGAAVRLTSLKTFDQDYHCQLFHGGISCVAGEPLTLTYFVRADQPRKYHVEVSSTAGGDWRDLGLYEQLDASEQWQKVSRTVFPQESIDGEVKVQFSFGDSTVPLELAGIGLQAGTAAAEVPADQRIESGSVAIPGPTSPVAAHTDMQQFMVDTEVAWVTQFKAFLRDELDVKVPLMASQINYHVPVVNAEVNDFVDLHNYWHHPLFPSGGNWDPERWTVGNEPMESDPARSSWPANSLLMRAGWRYEGKPFTMSEWNYPEPSPYSAGCVPMAAMIASLQDWDGVFFFQYDSESKTEADWDRDFTTSFFSFNGQPVKLSTFSVFANVFLRGDLAPLGDPLIAPVEQPASGLLALTRRLSVAMDSQGSVDVDLPPPNRLATPDESIVWNSNPETGTGHILMQTPATRGVWGTISDQTFETGNVVWKVEPLEPNYGVLAISSADGKPIESSQQMVLLAATSSENEAMGWNAQRDGVGTRWGTGPTSIVGITATVTVPIQGEVTVYSLDGAGQRVRQLPTKATKDGVEWVIRPDDQTLWYEINRMP